MAETGRIGLGLNSYGKVVSIHRCRSCGNVFSVVPPVTDEEFGDGCLAETCATYDLSRDIDLLWDHIEVSRGPA